MWVTSSESLETCVPLGFAPRGALVNTHLAILHLSWPATRVGMDRLTSTQGRWERRRCVQDRCEESRCRALACRGEPMMGAQPMHLEQMPAWTAAPPSPGPSGLTIPPWLSDACLSQEVIASWRLPC